MKKKTIRQSKRLIISLFVTFFCLTASAAQAQTALVTIDLQQEKMVQVMDEIENQTKYLFIYDKNMDTGRLVNVHVNKRPVPILFLLSGANKRMVRKSCREK